MSKKVYSASVDRELKSLQRNSIQEKRLSEQTKKVDMSIRRETKLTERQKELLKSDWKEIESKSPSVDEWKRQHQATYSSWRQRERDKINKRYRPLTRHYNPDAAMATTMPKGYKSLDEDSLSESLKGLKLLDEHSSSQTLKGRGSVSEDTSSKTLRGRGSVGEDTSSHTLKGRGSVDEDTSSKTLEEQRSLDENDANS